MRSPSEVNDPLHELKHQVLILPEDLAEIVIRQICANYLNELAHVTLESSFHEVHVGSRAIPVLGVIWSDQWLRAPLDGSAPVSLFTLHLLV